MLSILLSVSASALSAQSTGPREWAFGFSGVTYLLYAADAVYTDPDEHLSANFGFRLSRTSFGERRLGWILDGELYLGVAHRELIDVDMPNTIFGLQAFAGPALRFGPVQTYAAFGVNRTSVPESEIIEVPGLVVINYVGMGGLSDVWASYLNALGQSSGGAEVIASIPHYKKVAPAALFGFSYDFGSSAFGLRWSLDVIPMFIDGGTRTNFRTTLSLAG